MEENFCTELWTQHTFCTIRPRQKNFSHIMTTKIKQRKNCPSLFCLKQNKNKKNLITAPVLKRLEYVLNFIDCE